MPPAKHAGWMLESNPGGPLEGVELSDSLRRVIAILRPRRESVWRLVDDGYRVDWFCYLGSHAAEHAAELRRDLLAELLDLPGALLLDVYRDGPDDE